MSDKIKNFFVSHKHDDTDKIEVFDSVIKLWRNYNICYNEVMINSFIKFVSESYDMGIHGVPYNRKSGKFAYYRGEYI